MGYAVFNHDFIVCPEATYVRILHGVEGHKRVYIQNKIAREWQIFMLREV